MGVVGRNGAGKTSLLRVVAGEAPALAGRARIRGRRRLPAPGPAAAPGRGGAHGPRARAAVARPAGHGRTPREAPASRWRSGPRRSTSPASAGSRSGTATREATRGRRRPGGSSPASGLAPDRLDLPVPALSGGERRRLELARILFAGSDVLLLDEPTNHLDGDAKHWLMRFLAGYKGRTHRREPRPRRCSTRRSPGSCTWIATGSCSTAGRTRSTGRRASEDEVRLARIAERQRPRSGGCETLADSMRGQTAKRARKAKTLDTRAERLESVAVQAPTRERAVRYRFPDPPHSGKLALAAEGLTKGYGGPAGLRGRRLRRRPRGAAARHGVERRRQDEPAEDPGRRRGRGRRVVPRSGTACRSATTRRSTRASATA